MWRVDEDVLTQLYERLRSETFPGPDLFEPPDRSLLGELLRVALAASLTAEEARPTRFNLAYLSGRGSSLELDFDLAAPLPFDVENVRRLAPILEGPFAFLVVQRVDGRLAIVGGVRCVQPLEPSSRSVPAGLLLAASGPAELAVSLCGNHLLSTSGGEFTWTARAVGQDLGLCRVIDGALDLDKCDQLVSREAPTLLRLARAMLSHRHGGTILVVQGKDLEAKGLDIRYRVSSRESALKLEQWGVGDEARLRADPHSALTCEQRQWSLLKQDATLRSIAALTAVDGAVVLDSNLTLRGFGAIIADADPDSVPPDVKEAAFDAEGSLSVVASRGSGGTRHRSAARFVDQNPCKSLAFVASQDGMLSLWFGCRDGTVAVIRPIGPFAHSR